MGDALTPEAILDLMPFARHVGVEFVSATSDEVVGLLRWRAELCTAGGVLHGGALMTLADSVGAVCAFLNLPPDSRTSTIESQVNFLRPVSEGEVKAVARPLHVGRSVIVVRTEVTDRPGKLVAHIVQTQAVLR